MLMGAIMAVASLQSLEEFDRVTLTSPLLDGLPISLRTAKYPSPKPKQSPKHDWKFDLLSVVSVKAGEAQQDRFRVFAQSPISPVLRTTNTAQLLARLYDFNFTVLRLDHSPLFGDRQIDVYLCNEGTAGGEQMFAQDTYTPDAFGRPTKVNVIYIYDIDTLNDPLEACRELAHEYGHASLPPVNVPRGREPWANGHLGERLYLTWLREQSRKGNIKPADTLGTTTILLDHYFNAKVKPLVEQFLKHGPKLAQLKSEEDLGFQAYLAMAVYSFSILPAETFRRSLVLSPKETPTGFAQAVLEATNERPKTLIRPPFPNLVEFWVPVGKGKVNGAKVLEKVNGWARIRSTGPVSILSVVQD